MKVLVTGATGFIGGHVLQQLYNRGYKVRATVRSTKDPKRLEYLTKLCPGVEFFEADLLKSGSFDEAAKGCDVVIHVASPLDLTAKDPQKTLIEPALHGTLNVLEACKKSGTVKRVVLTSSASAIRCYHDDKPADHIYDEKDWNSVGSLTENPYSYSKTLAEKSAWEFVEKPENKGLFDLVTLLPTLVTGPLHSTANITTSVTLIKDLVVTYPAPPGFSFGCVDVRDVALAHVLAFEIKEAGGNRYIVTNSTHSLLEMNKMLNPHFPEYHLAQKELPKTVVYASAILSKKTTFSYIKHSLHKRSNFNNTKVQNDLKLQFMPIEKSLVDTVNSLIEFGVIPDKRHKKT